MSLEVDYISTINRERSKLWHGETEPWTGADWSNAFQAEAGEAGNVVKKLRRIETGVQGSQDPDREALLEMLAEELADTFFYMDLLAAYYDIDLTEAFIRKFNLVSVREGFPHRLRHIYPEAIEVTGG